MSSDKLEIVRKSTEAWQRDDFDGWLSLIHPDVSWAVAIERGLGGTVFHGREGMRELWNLLHVEFDDYWTEIDEIRDLGGKQVLQLTHAGIHGRASGLAFESELAHVMTPGDGGIVRSEDYLSHKKALEAVCLATFGVIEVRPVAPDPLAAKIEDARERLIHRGAATPAASLEPTQHKDPIAEVAKLLGDALELVPIFARVGDEPFDALASAVAARIECPDESRVPLEVGGRELGEPAIDVAAVVGINRSPGDLHFVLRHPRRSIAQPPPHAAASGVGACSAGSGAPGN